MLALYYPAADIQRIITACKRDSERVRDLPAVVMAYYVVALSLFPGVAYREVLEWLLCGLRWLDAGRFRVSGKGALSRARERLGEGPLRRMFEEMARPLERRDLPGCYWKGLHLVALDGSTMALQDTGANGEAFGRSSNQHGPGSYPLCRWVVLCEAGTHMVFAGALGSYRDAETVLAREVVDQLKPGMLCLADRLFPGFEFWKEASSRGAELLWRAKSELALECIEKFEDGSWMGRWLPQEQGRRGAEALVVRVIEYRLAQDGGGDKTETYRLLTTLKDPVEFPAMELAALYPERWEVELSIREAKEVLRGKQITLRSKLPELVRQEFWGLLLAHYLVRRAMALAALDKGRDPDGLSFKRSLEIIKSTQTGPVLSFSP
jgi:hypothetical protein